MDAEKYCNEQGSGVHLVSIQVVKSAWKFNFPPFGKIYSLKYTYSTKEFVLSVKCVIRPLFHIHGKDSLKGNLQFWITAYAFHVLRRQMKTTWFQTLPMENSSGLGDAEMPEATGHGPACGAGRMGHLSSTPTGTTMNPTMLEDKTSSLSTLASRTS